MDSDESILNFISKLRLLYVENDELSRELTLKILKELFDEVVVAVDAKEGLRRFRENRIDLVISDIVMKDIDGLELIRRIKDIDDQIPIILLSGYDDTDYFIKAIELGTDAYILKPLEIDKLLFSLKKVASKFKMLKEAQESISLLKQYQMIVDSSSIVSKTDVNGVITYVNEAFCDISGYEKDELIGKNHNIVRHPDESSEVFRNLWYVIKKEKKIWRGIIKNLKKDKTPYFVKATIAPILDKDNKIVEFIALRDDISDIMSRQREFDNQISLLDNPVIVYMKLEDFSSIEDFYDNETVNLIQERVKGALQKSMQEYGVLYGKIYQLRYGEFAIAFEYMLIEEDVKEFIRNLKNFQNEIRDKIVSIRGLQYQICLLVSVAYKNENILESARIGIKKLQFMKKAFIISNNFAQIEKTNARKNLETIATIKNAIQNETIVSHFQPIVCNSTKKVVRYESLVRLLNEQKDLLYPCDFLEVAKKGKYYFQLTKIVLENSFKVLNDYDIDIAINLSIKDLYSPSIRKIIDNLLRSYSKHTKRVTFELLEDEDIKNFNTISSFIKSIKKRGVKIAIDDFGSGYSNYERLLNYRPDILKIDGSLIRNLDKNSYSLSIVKTIVSFAKDQNILTTAEFVENESIFNIVRELGIDYSQGYFFGKSKAI